jgi:hypothetical protein
MRCAFGTRRIGGPETDHEGPFLPFWQDHMLKEQQSLTIRIWDMRTLVTPEMA